MGLEGGVHCSVLGACRFMAWYVSHFWSRAQLQEEGSPKVPTSGSHWALCMRGDGDRAQGLPPTPTCHKLNTHPVTCPGVGHLLFGDLVVTSGASTWFGCHKPPIIVPETALQCAWSTEGHRATACKQSDTTCCHH